jgi:hypothetical protein
MGQVILILLHILPHSNPFIQHSLSFLFGSRHDCNIYVCGMDGNTCRAEEAGNW